jgi:hypothetical protein
MKPDEVRSAVQVFLALVRDTVLTAEAAESTLPLVLDRLALAKHYTPEPTYSPFEAPAAEYDSIRSLVAQRFPNLGLYPVADASGAPGDAVADVGDAHDDLADIYGDLCTVEAAWARGEPGRALELFGSTFQFHWGKHLRELQLYLHARATQR